MLPESKRTKITINTAIPENASFKDVSIPAG
jgi:hypothetical protein